MMGQSARLQGFSLVELLITLAILGIVASFTIPGVLGVQNSNLASKQTAMAKDAAFMVESAFEQYRAANGSVPTTMKMDNLTPYMNYVNVDTTASLDDHPPNNSNYTCTNASYTCLRLHNGAILFWRDYQTFQGTSSTNAISYYFDPDGLRTGTNADGPGKMMAFLLYYNGIIKSRGQIFSNTYEDGSGPKPMNTAYDPSWFTGF